MINLIFYLKKIEIFIHLLIHYNLAIVLLRQIIINKKARKNELINKLQKN